MDSSNKKKVKVNFVRLMFATGLLGAIVFLLVLWIMFSVMTKDKKIYKKPDDRKEITQVQKTEKTAKFIGVVYNIDDKENRVTFSNVENKKKSTLMVEKSTELLNSLGQNMALSNLKVGQVVFVRYVPESLVVRLIKTHSETSEYVNQKIDEIDYENRLVAVGNTVFEYDLNTVFAYDNERIAVESIKDEDLVTIRATGKQIYSIEVTKSHGYLNILNTEGFEDAEIELIGESEGKRNAFYAKVMEIENTPIAEGTYRVVIDAKNMEIFTSDFVEVVAGEKVEIDLSEIKPLEGEMIFDVDEDRFRLIVINQDTKEEVYKTERNSRVKLPYGNYIVRVTKHGYTTWNRNLKLERETEPVIIELEKAKDLAKLRIATEPEFAAVYIDGDYMGTSPIIENIAYGYHRITIKKDGYVTQEYDVDVKSKEEKLIYVLHEGQSDSLKDNIYISE